jgi:hypothetical protein
VNHPVKSKINYTSLIVAVVGVSVALDFIPAEIEDDVVQITLIAGPMLIATLRTWFT